MNNAIRLVPQGIIESAGGKFTAHIRSFGSCGNRLVEFRRVGVRGADWQVDWTADTESLRDLAALMLRAADVADCKPEALASLGVGPQPSGVFV